MNRRHDGERLWSDNDMQRRGLMRDALASVIHRGPSPLVKHERKITGRHVIAPAGENSVVLIQRPCRAANVRVTAPAGVAAIREGSLDWLRFERTLYIL